MSARRTRGRVGGLVEASQEVEDHLPAGCLPRPRRSAGGRHRLPPLGEYRSQPPHEVPVAICLGTQGLAQG